MKTFILTSALLIDCGNTNKYWCNLKLFVFFNLLKYCIDIVLIKFDLIGQKVWTFLG